VAVAASIHQYSVDNRMADLKFKIEFNVLNHLGIGLYSSTPAVVTEIISNAWDADAKRVDVLIDLDGDKIEINDDGHGMSEEGVASKFLKVGYSRRLKGGVFSDSGSRRVMGRKGIGKLAMFSLAKKIEVITKSAESEPVAFLIDVEKLTGMRPHDKEDQIIDYEVEKIEVPKDFKVASGTRLVLRELNTKINKTEAFLRPRIARRFGVFSDSFAVSINGTPVTRVDAGFYQDLQFLWAFDQKSLDNVSNLAKNIASVERDISGVKSKEKLATTLPAEVVYEPGNLRISGFIATVDTPSKLGKGEESLNKISIFANGRLFQEDILSELGDARYFNSYIVGEINADFLDDDETDRATASREAIKHDDAKFQALRGQLKTSLATIRDQWDEWRNLVGYIKSPEAIPGVSEWITAFKNPIEKRAADRLMTSITNLKISNSDIENHAAKKMLYKSAVIGFEKLRVRNQLHALEAITDVLSPEFSAIFASLDDLEESHYLDITKTRLEVIRKFSEEIVDEKKLEKVAQKYLFSHLWLLDPSWDRVTGSETMERTMTAELKRACPDTLTGARLDIAYRTSAGRHVIIELKRPGLRVSATDLELQGRKYVEAMEQYYTDHPDVDRLNGRLPAIDVFFLVSKSPPMNDKQEKTFAVYNMKVLTYEGLIQNAKNSYQEYLAIKEQVGKLEAVLNSIG
jgi:Histidine kinase-, DNA gyrase B-, and HSP90-like ATPase